MTCKMLCNACVTCVLHLNPPYVVDSGQIQEPKFHTECFYLTYQCHHLVLLPNIRRLRHNFKELMHLRSVVEDMEQRKGRDAAHLDKYKQRVKTLMMYQASMDSVVLEESSLARVLQFYGMAAERLVGILCQSSSK